MALDFPNSPVNGQTHSSGSFTWTYFSPPGAWICTGAGGAGGGGIGSVSEDLSPDLGGDLNLAGHAILAATGTISGLTKTDVGLSNVDNTSDLNKPISTATQTALTGKAAAVHTHAQSDITNLVSDLALKAPLASPALTGIPTAPTAGSGTNTTQIATTAFVTSNFGNVVGPASATNGAVAIYNGTTGKIIANGLVPGAASGIATLDATGKITSAQERVTSVASRQGDVVLAKGDVGLSNVDNTTDLNKPISTATQTALNAKSDVGHGHSIGDVSGLQTALDAKETVGQYVGLNDQTGTTYTFVAADKGKLVSGNNAAAITFTVPPNSGVAYAVGSKIDVWQKGAGQITVAPGSGVTLRSSGAKLKLSGQYSAATLVKLATDEWLVFGDLTT